MEGESTAGFIFDDLGSLRLVLRTYSTSSLHRRVARSGASSTSDVRGSQDRHEPCEEDNAKVLVTFLWDGRQHKGPFQGTYARRLGSGKGSRYSTRFV